MKEVKVKEEQTLRPHSVEWAEAKRRTCKVCQKIDPGKRFCRRHAPKTLITRETLYTQAGVEAYANQRVADERKLIAAFISEEFHVSLGATTAWVNRDIAAWDAVVEAEEKRYGTK